MKRILTVFNTPMLVLMSDLLRQWYAPVMAAVARWLLLTMMCGVVWCGGCWRWSAAQQRTDCCYSATSH